MSSSIRAAFGAQGHQGGLALVGHGAAQRVVQGGHDGHRLDGRVAVQREGQGLDRQAVARAGGQLDGAQAQGLDDLQQAVEAGRLHRHRAAGLGHRPQRQVHGLGGALGDDHLFRRGRHAAGQGAGPARRAAAGGRAGVMLTRAVGAAAACAA
jgi:hypothetical protein